MRGRKRRPVTRFTTKCSRANRKRERVARLSKRPASFDFGLSVSRALLAMVVGMDDNTAAAETPAEEFVALVLCSGGRSRIRNRSSVMGHQHRTQ